jgi:hypothetical protein
MTVGNFIGDPDPAKSIPLLDHMDEGKRGEAKKGYLYEKVPYN